MQLDLIPRDPLKFAPLPQRNEPPLWVRRLVILREPGNVIRDIHLRKGLNIVWSPDPGELADLPIGHGSGKTTFCRLLRFCLGEASFAPEGQRMSTWDKLPKGLVGAEILVSGKLYSVVRTFENARLDTVAPNMSLADLLGGACEPNNISILKDAITESLLGNAVDLMPQSIGPARAWEATLAWITRDQECRFSHPLDWRDPDTDSRSPVRNKSKEDLLTVVRALLGAMTADELIGLEREESSKALVEQEKRTLARLKWQLGRAHARLIPAQPDGSATDPSSVELEVLSAKAREAHRKALGNVDHAVSTDLTQARHARDKARAEHSASELELERLKLRIEERTRSISMMRGELPEASARIQNETIPVCPVCRVAIDKALAEGCGISTATCDLEDLRAQVAHLRAGIAAELREVDGLKAGISAAQQRVAIAKQTYERLEDGVLSLERAQLQRSKELREAERMVDALEDLEALRAETAAAERSLEASEVALSDIREQLAAHRAAAASSISRLSRLFDGVLRRLVSDQVSATAKLDGNRLSLKVDLNGVRTSAAIESLKSVAFDLAALMMGMEGKALLPSFLVHDSPREADLGESIYFRLFRLISWIEAATPSPLFQYVVTTTTAPPPEYLNSDQLILMLRGAPASERLLRSDL